MRLPCGVRDAMLGEASIHGVAKRTNVTGVLPQQAPMMSAPLSSSGTTPQTICSGVSS